MADRRPRVLGLLILAIVSATRLRAQDSILPPRTVDEAVSVLRHRWLHAEDEDLILRMPKDFALAHLHMPFGTAVRNEFHLWSDNEALRRSCGTEDPEGCSGLIFEHLWGAIRASADSHLVNQLDCQFRLSERVQVR